LNKVGIISSENFFTSFTINVSPASENPSQILKQFVKLSGYMMLKKMESAELRLRKLIPK
jgi:hypothetical protein